MIRFILLFFIVCLSLPLISQDDFNSKWILSVDFAKQKHDKRLFDYADKALLLRKHPESYGTYQLGISISKKILDFKKISIYTGVGLSTELATFTRPYNHSYVIVRNRNRGGLVTSDDYLRWTDRYYQNLLQLPVKLKYTFIKRLSLTLDLLPQFNFLTIADISKVDIDREKSLWWRFNFYAIEVNPGIEFGLSRFNFGFKYRAYQLKRIDRILFNDIIYDPRVNQTNETYNLKKFWMSVGFEF